MKVLIISNMYPHARKPYSGSFVREQVGRLTTRGIECTVVASGESRKGIWYVIPKYLNLLIRTFMVGVNNRFDIIHAHYAFPTGLIALIVSSICRVPLLITVHGGDIQYIKPYTFNVVKYTLQKSDYVVAVSSSVQKKLCEVFSIPKSLISVINMGVDTDLFRPIPQHWARNQLDLPQSATIIVTVGNLIWRKGIHYLLQAIVGLNTVNGLYLCVVGNGPQAKEFKQISQNLDISDKVNWVGAIEKEQIPMWMSSADCIVHPALEEPFGLAVIEGMSCEKLVIASAVGGIPSFIVDGENGFLVEPGNPKALEKKIKYVLSLPKKQSKRVQHLARVTAIKHDSDLQASKVKQVYDQIRAS